MSGVVKDVLSTLGFHGLESKEDYDLLELLLSNVDPENILMPEELEILEDADLSFVGDEVETLVLDGLKSNGIDEESLNMDDLDGEYIENKLSCMESCIWDKKIDMLRKQMNHEEKVLEQINRRFFDFHLGRNIQDSEKEWTKLHSCFDVLLEDLQQIESCSKNPENTRAFQLFVDAHQNGLEKFIEAYNQCLHGVLQIKIKINDGKEEYFFLENGLVQLWGSSENFCAVQSRLACAVYNIHYKYADCGSKLLMAACERKPTISDIESVSDKYLVSILTLCDKWAELHIKENIILPKLDENKALVELTMTTCGSLKPVLHEQLAHQLLVSAAAYIWIQDQNGSTAVVQSCHKHFQEELSNVLSRVSYLEEVKKKYDSYLNSEEYNNSFLEKLRRLSGSVIPDGEKYIAEIIERKEKELQLLVNQQNAVLMNGKEQVRNAEESIEKMRRSINSNMQILSQFQEGYNESLSQLQLRKDYWLEVTEQLEGDPIYCKSRLLWVYFLTDHKKLHNFKALKDFESPPYSNEMSFKSFNSKLFMGTSTPKKSE